MSETVTLASVVEAVSESPPDTECSIVRNLCETKGVK